MIEYKYKKVEDIVKVNRHGEVSFDEMIDYINNISVQFKNNESLYLLTDIRESTVKINVEDFPVILSEIKKQLHHYKEVKDAILVDEPLSTAFAFFFQNISKDMVNYYYKVFSTEHAAKEWLQIRK
jgi:SpoIIAA-like